MLSGCSLLLVAWGDLTTLDPVQSVDVLWAKRADFCAAMIHKDGREAFLLEGNLDAPDYAPTVGWSNSKVTKSGVVYNYSEGQSIDFDETLSMPPMEAPPARISPTPSKRLGAALSTAWRRTAACHANTPS
jgi:hypothetical protein